MSIDTHVHEVEDDVLLRLLVLLTDEQLRSFLRFLFKRDWIGKNAEEDAKESDGDGESGEAGVDGTLQYLKELVTTDKHDDPNGQKSGKVYLECRTGGSKKFWQAETFGTTVIVEYGRIGSKGVTQTKWTSDAAAFIADKVKEKLRKGYRKALEPDEAKNKPLLLQRLAELSGLPSSGDAFDAFCGIVRKKRGTPSSTTSTTTRRTRRRTGGTAEEEGVGGTTATTTRSTRSGRRNTRSEQTTEEVAQTAVDGEKGELKEEEEDRAAADAVAAEAAKENMMVQVKGKRYRESLDSAGAFVFFITQVMCAFPNPNPGGETDLGLSLFPDAQSVGKEVCYGLRGVVSQKVNELNEKLKDVTQDDFNAHFTPGDPSFQRLFGRYDGSNFTVEKDRNYFWLNFQSFQAIVKHASSLGSGLLIQLY
eukprot:TRINITY_DN902_c0_g4_i1.p1 TRINITY_DN902_c0_g4~~TRINITY_DN902_c0_g4_i1.p1  ORF type:complete len:421 (+),score=119.57 TRINITY_DN902_c0_g4_i1:206-1468(+)